MSASVNFTEKRKKKKILAANNEGRANFQTREAEEL